MRILLVIALGLMMTLCGYAGAQPPPIRIVFWHSLAGKPGFAINKITHDFNQSQHKYKVINMYKGDYNTTLTELIAAYRAHKQPAMSQVLEIGTATMMAAKPAIVPVYQVMQQGGYQHFNRRVFLPAIGLYYSNAKGQMMAMPLNASSPVLYYNKTIFKKAGLNPNHPPATWPELAKDGRKIIKAGYHCAYTSTWLSWIQLEEFSAWNNIPFTTQANGFAGVNKVKALYDNSLVLKQITALTKWEKSGIFQYGGRGDNAQTLFTSGHCAMFTQSSGSRGSLLSSVQFAMGMAPMPYWPKIKNTPQNSIIGGASIWVMRGYSPKVYRGVAAFFHYLMRPKVQAFWQKETGYMVVTKAAYKASLQSGYYQRNPGSDVAIKELTNKPPTANSRGIRLGNYLQIRMVNDTALEAAFSHQMTPKQALRYAEKHANHLLARFAEMTGTSS
jgi:sn-glycerol 3-phosphate transport system substrate-binding protein